MKSSVVNNVPGNMKWLCAWQGYACRLQKNIKFQGGSSLTNLSPFTVSAYFRARYSVPRLTKGQKAAHAWLIWTFYRFANIYHKLWSATMKKHVNVDKYIKSEVFQTWIWNWKTSEWFTLTPTLLHFGLDIYVRQREVENVYTCVSLVKRKNIEQKNWIEKLICF